MLTIRVLKRSDIARCPAHRLDARHYRSDGTCRCQPPATPTSPKEQK